MKIIVGLGNPGKDYEQTRHNIGWLFLEYLAEKYDTSISKSNCDSLIGETKINNEKIIFAKPLTYMNLSGNAVSKLKKWYKVENEDILIIYDDIDIPFGNIRFREKGSGGTHNGMKNIVQMLSTQEISRIRIGLGGLKHEKQNMADFVLQRFKKEELEKLNNEIFPEAEVKFEEFLDK
ncbi:MAG: aminoacyl-tRNA hydrolase [Clostridia bacterium]|nr:aminoacyl-tRNA hydrolase [Clostridia bacterium]